jgi:hypothetical protein
VTGLETIRVPRPGDGIAGADLKERAGLTDEDLLRQRHGRGVSLETGLDVEDAAWRTAAASPDRREGIAAFAEKRKPVWPGR